MNKAVSIFFISIWFLSCQNFALAQNAASTQDKIIAGTFKALAKTFVASVDINRVKLENIEKIRKMDEIKYKKRYAKAYLVLKDLPPELKRAYAIKEEMPKWQAIRNIYSLDKKTIYKIVDLAPDILIAAQFHEYLRKKKEDLGSFNLVTQINKIWKEITASITTS